MIVGVAFFLCATRTHSHTRTHERTHARTHARTYPRTHTHIHTYARKRTHACTQTHTQRTLITSLCPHSFKHFPPPFPAIAQLVGHLVDLCSNQMVPGSIPGGWIFSMRASNDMVHAIHIRTKNAHTNTHTMMIADDRTCFLLVSSMSLCIY